MTRNGHDGGSQSVQGEQADSNHYGGSQSIQDEQSDSNHGDGSQPVQPEQPVQQYELAVNGPDIVEFDFSTLRQHPALTIEKTEDNFQMIIDLDFSQSESLSDIKALLEALMGYAAVIYDVKILIKAPKQHHNFVTCNDRLAKVAMVIFVLNSFNLTKVEVIARLDDHYSFKQLGLTIAAYQLKLSSWTLAYEVLGLDGKWVISVDSEDELRLRGRYRNVFLKEH
ncbi:uncharacterized protein EAF02_002644 [Botrytis sinoallii]|uniref:uncharacterized protein n=1 Tax=Botrytis sinoallii TaxID=1463999 RepID=UPI0018FFD876|nr:uncharacterized protein EAF02_002644 [Botrytis sinoallii]KAF7888103.1 hypothetical protein EAF02_002644 [Botrytis sinoallii]